MQSFSEQLAELPEFIDVRREPLDNIMSLIDVLIRDVDANMSIDEAMRELDTLNVPSKLASYNQAFNGIYNRALQNALNSISLRGIKPVLGDDTYV